MWLRGRRAAYVGPLRLYLATALLFFVTMPWTFVSRVIFAYAMQSRESAVPTRDEVMANVRFLEGSLPALLIVLFVPIFAALLMLTNRRRPFVVHMVTALHFHAFAFLLVSLTALLHIPFGTEWETSGFLWTLLILWTFLVVTVSRVYTVRWFGAVVRVSVVALFYAVGVSILIVRTVRMAL